MALDYTHVDLDRGCRVDFLTPPLSPYSLVILHIQNAESYQNSILDNVFTHTRILRPLRSFCHTNMKTVFCPHHQLRNFPRLVVWIYLKVESRKTPCNMLLINIHPSGLPEPCERAHVVQHLKPKIADQYEVVWVSS